MKSLLSTIAVCFLLLAAAGTQAQVCSVYVSDVTNSWDDNGVIKLIPNAVNRFTIHMVETCQETPGDGFWTSNAFHVWSPDSVSWTYTKGGLLKGFLDIWNRIWVNHYKWDPDSGAWDKTNDSITGNITITKAVVVEPGDSTGLVFSQTSGLGLPYGTDADMCYIEIQNQGEEGAQICIDSGYVPGGLWRWANIASGDVYPGWQGLTCYTIEMSEGPDSDGDGVPDPCDQCPGYDDNQDINNNGVPDGCDTFAYMELSHVHGQYNDSTVVSGNPVTFYIRGQNELNDIVYDMQNRFRIFSPDGATWSTPVADTVPGFSQWLTAPSLVDIEVYDSDADTIYLKASWVPSGSMPQWFNVSLFKITTTIDPDQAGKTICFDSCSTGAWRWTSYAFYTPYWEGDHCFTITDECCRDMRGNVNYDPEDLVGMGDLTVLIDHLFISMAPLVCPEEADLDENLMVDMGDLTVLIDHLFISLDPLPACP